LFNVDPVGLLLHDARNVPWNLTAEFIDTLWLMQNSL